MTKPLKADNETHQRIKDLSFELSDIEKENVTMQEVLQRTFKAPDIPKRLKEGSVTRRSMR